MLSTLFPHLVVAAAGIVYGSTGFGFGLVAIPILALALEPAAVVPLVGVVSFPLTVGLCAGLRASAERRLLLPLLAGSAVAMPLGVLLLRDLPAATMKRAVGIVTVAAAVLMLAGWRRPLDHDKRRWPAMVGVGAGLLGSGAGLPGPPILLFLANQGETREVFRSTLVGFFLFTSLGSLAGYALAGLLDSALLGRAATLIPAALAGALVGARVGRRLDEALFRRLVLALTLVAGISLIVAPG